MTAAAWVQAIGSVAAICVAIAIPAWQRWVARRDAATEQLLRARSLVFGVSSELLEIEAAHQNATKIFADALCRGQGSGSGVREFIGRANIVAPPMLLNASDRFYLLGEPAGLTLPQLVTVVLQYERKLAQIISGLPAGTQTVSFSAPLKDLEGHLKIIGDLLYQTDSELKKFDIGRKLAPSSSEHGAQGVRPRPNNR